jgi:hypothetical protein
MTDFDFDVFISHASEDKAAFVTPLANALKKYGLRVWFDKFTLKVGDSLHASIERGLARSRYGVVVFSPKFLAKNWPMAELNGLFAREMEGRKVILPVWHKMSSARMKKALPMQADKYALRSSEGIDAVARALVEVIRPELLELDVRKETAFEAGESFIEEARLKHPGYDFSVQSGAIDKADSPGTSFATIKGRRKIEIRVSDPSAIASPPGGRVTFFGEGAKKAIEFERTGKPQTWQPGEFVLEGWNIPLMPSDVEKGILAVGERKLPNILPRHIRVEVGSPPTVEFPIMELRLGRVGTDEAEAVLSDGESPLKISMIFGVGTNVISTSREVDFTLSWRGISGKRPSECKKMIVALDALRDGGALRLIDIRSNKLIFESKALLSGNADPFEPRLRRTVFLASQIEEQFSIPLRMPDVISEEDGESLFYLDCLLNGREFGRPADTTFRLVKTDGEVGAAQEAFVRGEWTLTLTDTPSNYPGNFALFGQRIVTPAWIRAMEFVPLETGVDAEEFVEAPIGSELVVEITAKGPAFLRWKNQEAKRDS